MMDTKRFISMFCNVSFNSKYLYTMVFLLNVYRLPEIRNLILIGLPSKPGLPGTTVNGFYEGVNLPIKTASISLNNREFSRSVSLFSGEEIVFEAPVNNGNHQLRAWFTDENEAVFAAFYVNIEKI